MNATTTDTITEPDRLKGWRAVLPVHPAADLFPPMSEAELRELANDIKKHGLREQPQLYRDRELGLCVLDGRNRLDACELIGRETVTAAGSPKVGSIREWSPSFDPVAFVLTKNLYRRHLTSEQKRELIARVLKARPEPSDRRIATVTGRSKTTVAAQRKKLESGGQIDHLEKRTGADGKEQAAHKKSLPQTKAQHDGHHGQASGPECLEAKADSAVAEEASGLVEQTDSAGNREVHHDLTGRRAQRAEARCAAQWKAFTAQEERVSKPVTPPLPEVAPPEVIEENLLYTIARMNEHARVFRKLFKASSFDREQKARISEAID
jgi:hypothetical protein